ncbi:hypothetical protein LP52_18125 [Streptomonospora alba]|uniref:ATP-grasp domain-containing protein n=1 Tax=Streptomonospora alba TaxID=183763 RepID=A0A0C2J835_9ACTN|nr:ATP-grasp domain-containing protein [Streptomonospora alba]KIH97626.1 hypothetical protein LP52_18125 [Streptomonospora alba]
MTRILLLEAAGPESGALARTAARQNFAVYAATHPARYSDYPPWLREILTDWLATDFTTPDRALAEITAFARSNRIDAVLTASEYLTPLAARACAALGLPGNDLGAAEAARNKVTMAARFDRCGVDAPPTSVPHSADAAAALTRRPGGLPCVVKPAEQAGSHGVTIAHDTDQAVEGYRRARRLAYESTYGLSLDTRALVQPLVAGTEYSVESITAQGRSHHVCITRKHTVAGIETGHDLPELLPPHTRRRILAETDKALAALGVCNSASHTEVIVEPSGRCRIIEVGARTGAGRIGFLIGYALGIDWWQACIDTSLACPVELSATRSRHAAIRFLTSSRHGTLQGLDHLPTTEPDVPEIHLRAAVGERMEPTSGNSTRLGSFITVGSTSEALSRRADELLGTIRVRLASNAATPPPETGVQYT